MPLSVWSLLLVSSVVCCGWCHLGPPAGCVSHPWRGVVNGVVFVGICVVDIRVSPLCR